MRPGSGCRVVGFGDSITYAQHLPLASSWTSHLGAVNLGVCGDTTRLGLERFPQVRDAQPDAVVIQFGLNDCNRWDSDGGLPRVSVAGFEANLVELVQRVRLLKADPLVCTLTTSTRESLLTPHAYSIAAIRAAERTGAKVVDLREGITTKHLLDGVHLNEEGQRLFAEAVSSCLR